MSRLVLSLALIAVLALASFGARALIPGNNSTVQQQTDAQAFARRHHSRCVASGALPDPESCALRTIQLASQLHGLRYGDEVAAALR